MTEQTPYRQAAAAALENAASLYKDARLLFEHERLGPAFALAVIADEELAKSILYAVAAFNGPDSLPGLRRAVRFHGPKQGLTEFVAMFAEVTRPGFDEAYGIGRAVATGELTLDDGVDPAEYAKDRAVEKIAATAKGGAPLGGGLELLQQGRVQTLKNACLYVDVSAKGELCTPVTAAPNRGSVAEYLEGVSNRLSFVGYMFAGSKGEPLEPKTLGLIRRCWSDMRARRRL